MKSKKIKKKNKSIKLKLFLVLVIALTIGVVVYINNHNPYMNNAVPKNGIYFNKANITVVKGKSETLKVSINPEGTKIGTIKWTSGNTKIAKVDKNGKVTGVGVGTTSITATANGKTITCEVTVYIPVNSINLNKTNLTLGKGISEQLIVTINPTNATNTEVTWTSSNTKIAKVDKNGKVAGVSLGNATITATVDGKKVTCKVSIINYVITNDTKFASYSKEATYSSGTLKYNVIKKGGDIYSLIWVKDANKQWNSALPKYGSVSPSLDILNKEIKDNGYIKKGLIATNGGPFWDGWGNKPCIPFVINKGKIILDIKNTKYENKVYQTLGMTKNGTLKAYQFSKDDYTYNQKVKQQMINDGLRNNFSIFGQILYSNGNTTNDTNKNRRTVLCQVDNNNFVIYSGNKYTLIQVTRELRDTFHCKTAYNFDGGSSQALYYKTNSMSSVKRIINGRDTPDMMYFVEE